MRIATIRGRAFPPFASVDRFDSSSGWPSFTKPLVPENVVEIGDTNHSITYLTQFSKDGAKR
jgi:peptide methionine sulfoxide reductase MsrB